MQRFPVSGVALAGGCGLERSPQQEITALLD
jgi:hypothetical protein